MKGAAQRKDSGLAGKAKKQRRDGPDKFRRMIFRQGGYYVAERHAVRNVPAGDTVEKVHLRN